MAVGFEEFESSKAYADYASRRNAPPAYVSGTLPDPARYAPPETRARWPEARPEPLDPGGAELFAQNVAIARGGKDDEAKFVMLDMVPKWNRLQRAVGDKDVALVGKMVSEIDGFVDEHYDGLSEWMGVSRAGAQGQRLAGILGQFLNGDYKDSTGARGLLDDNTEEYKASKASRLSNELSVNAGVARSIIDPDDPMHQAFSMFSDLASPAPSGGPGMPREPDRMSRESRKSFLAGAARLQASDDTRFTNAGTMSRFLSAFDQAVNKKGVYAGDKVLEKVARGFLSGDHGLTEHDFVTQYGELVDRLAEQASGGESAKAVTPAERRMARHEANAIASEFVALTGGTIGPEGASALESAASTVRMANDMFGVATRGGANYARKVAEAARAAMGDPRADDGGLYRMVSDAAADLSTLVSAPTRELMSTIADGKGQAHVGVVKAPNRYSNLEMFAVKALGRAVSGLADGVDGVMPSGKGWGALKQFAAGNEVARSRLTTAVADALDTRFGYRPVSERIAGDVVDRFLGVSDDGRTIEERLRGYTGRFDPVTDRPEIPANVRLSANMSDDEFRGLMAQVAVNPDQFVPVLKGDTETVGVLRRFASKVVDLGSRGKTVDASRSAGKAFGELAVAQGVDDPFGLVKEGWLNNFSKVGASKEFNAKDLKFLEKAIGGLATVVSENPGPAAADDIVLLTVLARGAGWKSFREFMTGGRAYYDEARTHMTREEESRRLHERNVMLDRVDEALAKVGISKHMTLSAALNALRNSPGIFERSTLMSSGLVVSGDNPVDYKRFLATLQRNAYADMYTEKKDNPTDFQREARRIYQSFGSRDDVLAKLKSDVLEHFRADGASEEELMRIDYLASKGLVEHYQNGGPAAAELFANQKMSLSRRYFPVVNPNMRTVDVNSVEVSGLMTQEEYEAEVKRRQKMLKEQLGVDYSDAVFFDANARGLATWKHNVATAERIKVSQLMKTPPLEQ